MRMLGDLAGVVLFLLFVLFVAAVVVHAVVLGF